MITRTSLLALPLLTSSLLLSGCLLYSPYVSPVVQPLEKGEVEMSGGVGLMPRFIAEDESDLSIEGGVRYALTDQLTLGGRLWSSAEMWESEEGIGGIDGFGFDGSWLLSNPDRTDAVRIAPTLHVQWGSQRLMGVPGAVHPRPQEDDTVETRGIGYGAGINLWTPMIGPLQPFTGISARRYTFDTEGEYEMSFTTVGLHGGLGYEVTDHLNVSLEAVGVYEIPEENVMRDDVGDRFLLTPMLRAAWRF